MRMKAYINIVIYVLLSAIMCLLCACGSKDKSKNNNLFENIGSVQEDDNEAGINKTTEQANTSSEIFVNEDLTTTKQENTTEQEMTTEDVVDEKLEQQTKKEPLSFGDKVNVDTLNSYSYSKCRIKYVCAVEDYNNRRIDLSFILKETEDEYGFSPNGNVSYCGVYDENFDLLEGDSVFLESEGIIDSITLGIKYNAVCKLEGDYGDRIPKYIGVEYYLKEFGEDGLYAYYEIPDGLYDADYVYVDTSIMGADSEEEAFDLFVRAMRNNLWENDDFDLLKKISSNYNLEYYMPQRELIDEKNIYYYLGINVDSFLDFIRAGYCDLYDLDDGWT